MWNIRGGNVVNLDRRQAAGNSTVNGELFLCLEDDESIKFELFVRI